MERQILLVDDEPAVRDLLAFLLRRHGFPCIEFANGGAALEHLAAAEGDNVALILSDIGMEGISGLELLAKVRSFAPYLPVVLLSGSCDQPLAVDAYRTGASDYLLKPVSEKDLIDMVRKHHGGCEPWSEELIRRLV